MTNLQACIAACVLFPGAAERTEDRLFGSFRE